MRFPGFLIFHTCLLICICGCQRTQPDNEAGDSFQKSVDTNAMGSAKVDLEAWPQARVQRQDHDVVVLDLRQVAEIDDHLVELIVREFPKLRNLQLAGPAITNESLRHISQLRSLAALGLQQTAVDDDGAKLLPQLPQLRELSLYGSPVSDAALEPLAELTKLTKLRLRATRITGQNAAFLTQMQAVVELELAETTVGNDAMPHIAGMPGLERLNLWLTQVDDAGLKHLQGRSGLTSLNLDNVAGITDASMPIVASLPRLTFLHLGGTAVSDAGLPALYPLQGLQTLFLTRTAVSRQGIAKLQRAIPDLQKLEHDFDQQ